MWLCMAALGKPQKKVLLLLANKRGGAANKKIKTFFGSMAIKPEGKGGVWP